MAARKSAAETLAAELNKKLGSEAISLGSDPKWKVSYLSTGIVAVDYLLQGGLPRGRFIEIYGDYSTLKTYVALRAIATTQAAGGKCALVDTEHSFDPEWAVSCGVDIATLMLSQPETGEEAVDAGEVHIRAGVDLLVFDSVASLLPKSEQEVQLGRKTPQPARLAALMSLAMRKLTAANSSTAVLWINQTRMNVGVTFGSPETTPGGKALGFYSSIRIAMRKAGRVTEDVVTYKPGNDGKPAKTTSKKTVAQVIKATVEKSKLNRPYNEVWFTFDLRTASIDDIDFLAREGLAAGVVQTNGRGFYWLDGDEQKFRGLELLASTHKHELASRLGLTLPGSPPAPKKRAGIRRKQ